MKLQVNTVKGLYNYLLERLTRFLPAEEAGSYSIWLLEELFSKSRMDLVLNDSMRITQEEQDRLEQILSRLEKNEPIQYVLGQAPFYGRAFRLNPAVLIPRPETEELVHLIVRENRGKRGLHALDIGTGSGCIAISLAKELKEAVVYGIDVSPLALKVAGENAQNLGAELKLQELDILKSSPTFPKLDIIVSNPPYIRKEEAALMNENVLLYEPHLALFVEDEDPLLFYRRISFLASSLLKSGGTLYFEINEAFGIEVAELLSEQGFERIKVIPDMQGKQRIISASWPED